MPVANPVTVFYDGSCPLCTREIGLYRRCQGADKVSWIDISRMDDGDVAPGLSKRQALRQFHVMRSDGSLVAGGQAFAALWAALPGLSYVGRVFQVWPLSVLINLAYRAFLPARPWLQRRFLGSKKGAM